MTTPNDDVTTKHINAYDEATIKVRDTSRKSWHQASQFLNEYHNKENQ